jgi:hypothetical protein
MFQTLWADHIDAFVAYTRSLATNDAAGRDAAWARLQQFNADFAGFCPRPLTADWPLRYWRMPLSWMRIC